MCVFVVREDRVLVLMNTLYVCVVRGYLLLAPIKVRVCVGRRDRMLALINTMCVCFAMGDQVLALCACG